MANKNPDFADKFGPTRFVSFDVLRVFPGTSGVVQLLAEESFGRFAVKRFKEKGGKEALASEKMGVIGSTWLWVKNRYRNGNLVNGNMDYNLRSPGGFILTHTHMLLFCFNVVFCAWSYSHVWCYFANVS